MAPTDFLVQAITDAYPSLKHIFKTLSPLSRQDLLSGLLFLFILDSVDELADAAAIAKVNRLYNPVQWLASVFFISARSEVLDNLVLSDALPPRQFLPDGPAQPALMSQLHLLPFDASQRAKYIDVFARQKAPRDWTAEKYTQALKQFPEVDSMLQELLQLFLILSVVPVLVAAKDEAVPTDFCVQHQGVTHTVHVLYREEDKNQALKLAADIEQHSDAKRKGLTVFLKDTACAWSGGEWARQRPLPLLAAATYNCPTKLSPSSPRLLWAPVSRQIFSKNFSWLWNAPTVWFSHCI